MKKYRIIIAGSRSCPENNQILLNKISNILKFIPKNDIEIVSGKARGADRLGEYYAELNNLPIKSFPARWDKYDKAAGIIRNTDMADYGTHLIAFWDGKSSGTKDMITKADNRRLKVKIININLYV